MEKLLNANLFSCCADTTFLASQLNDDRWPFEWLNKGEPKGILSDGCRSSAHCSLPSGFDSSNPHSFFKSSFIHLLRSRELIAQKTK